MFFLLYKKKNNKKKDAIISLKDATVTGEKLSSPTFIAKKAEPHIADNMRSKIKLFTIFGFFKNYILFLG